MPRTPSEYIIHMLFDGGHHEEVRFSSIQDFQKWYSGELMPKATSEEFITVPLHLHQKSLQAIGKPHQF